MTHIISSLLDYSNLYDLYLIDLWGLTHNGKEPFPTAINVFKELKLQGKTLIVISNAPRLPSTVKHLLQTNMNINADQIFDGMITSGLLCRQYIKQTYMGKKLYHIGSQNDGDIYEDLCKTSTLKKADFVLLTGTEGGYNSTESFTEVLTQIAQLRLPVLCANPDQYVYVGSNRYICAGALATRYTEIYEQIHQHKNIDLHIFGKPYPEIFDQALDMAEQFQTQIDKNRIIMLGDSLQTDIKGANLYGIHSLFTLSGVHQDEPWNDLEEKMINENLNPTHNMQGCLK